jgi:hypothetical protein
MTSEMNQETWQWYVDEQDRISALVYQANEEYLKGHSCCVDEVEWD